MRRLRRVLLIHPEGNTYNNPTLKCIVDLLLDKGVHVDIRYQKSELVLSEVSGLTLLPFSLTYARIKNLIFNRICSKWLSWVSVQLERIFIYKNYDLIIGVDRLGLIEAAFLYQSTKTPYVFFSFEIMFEIETSKSYKLLERGASKYVTHWVVQDELRASKLEVENELGHVPCSLIPLASSATGMVTNSSLRDRLRIPKNKKVALIMGSISNWSMTGDIIKSVLTWDEEWVLIVHERYGNTEAALSSIGVDVAEINHDKVFFSSDAPEKVDDMGCILSGVSAGFAFYKPDYSGIYTGRNLKYLGLASGKISTFLRYGIPIVMNEIGLYAEMAKRYHFGVVATNMAQIAGKLRLLDQKTYGAHAIDFYNSTLDFDRYKKDVWEMFVRAAKGHRSSDKIS